MNWDTNERVGAETVTKAGVATWRHDEQVRANDIHRQYRADKQTKESSSVRNILLFTITVLMFIQVGFSVIHEVRYQQMLNNLETIKEKWTGEIPGYTSGGPHDII